MRTRMRHPKTTQERRQNQDGWSRPARRPHNLPDYRDEFWVRTQKSWKSHRQEQYRALVLQEDDPEGVKDAGDVEA